MLALGVISCFYLHVTFLKFRNKVPLTKLSPFHIIFIVGHVEIYFFCFSTPMSVGTLWAMDKSFFFEIGGFDDGMVLWGGENIDLPIRVIFLSNERCCRASDRGTGLYLTMYECIENSHSDITLSDLQDVSSVKWCPQSRLDSHGISLVKWQPEFHL